MMWMAENAFYGMLGLATGVLQAAVGLAFVVAVAGAPLGYFGVFGQTGADYFQQCWEMTAAIDRIGVGQPSSLRPRPQAASARQAVVWETCDETTKRAVFREGMVFAGTWVKLGDEAITRACPSYRTDVPWDGAYGLTIDLVIKDGGPDFADNFLPARFMIERLWRKRYPACSAARSAAGYPIIEERAPGEFGFASPCAKCN